MLRYERIFDMKKMVLPLLLLGLILSGCGLRNRPRPVETASPPDLPSAAPTLIPSTGTASPTFTLSPTPAPDFSRVGLPAESAGEVAMDFVGQLCQAQWFSGSQLLPCPGNDGQQDTGFVMSLDGSIQGLPSNLGLLLAFPPANYYGTLYSKYPVITIKDGDRFRAVLACRAHSFCDVQFGLEYYDAQGKTGLRHWNYLFADPPVVVDYPLGGLAGKSVQLSLTVTARGNPSDANAVWIAPHIYRPASMP